MHTPFYYACKNRQHDAAKLLIEKGTKMDWKTKRGYTMLHYTSYIGWVDISLLLIEYGADVNAQSDEKQTPIYLAIRYNHIDMVKLLIDHGADVNPTGISVDLLKQQSGLNILI